MPEFEGQTSEWDHPCVGENPLNPSRSTERRRVQEEGQNVVEHEVSRPCFPGSCTDGFPAWLIMCWLWRGGDGLSSSIIVAVALTWCQDFLYACPVHAPLPASFVNQPCSQEPSLGVPNGMLAALSMVSVPYVCVCDCIHMYEWEIGVRASYVAVVFVVVCVDASLIPVNGLLGLNRRGAFVWAGSIIHLLRSCLWGSRGVVAYNTGMALTLKASLSVLYLPLLTLSLCLIILISHFSSSWHKCRNSHHSKPGCDPGLSCSVGFHVRWIDVLLWTMGFSTLQWWKTTSSPSESL